MLSILDCRQEYPRLASALAGQRAVAETRPVSEPARLLEWSGKVGDKVRNHIWTFRLHEGGVMRSAAWRLLTEPFNQAVFR
jgi:hypothetical protein